MLQVLYMYVLLTYFSQGNRSYGQLNMCKWICNFCKFIQYTLIKQSAILVTELHFFVLVILKICILS